MVATPDAVELSIVVATDQAGPGLRRCVSALKPQLCVGKIEAIVVNGSAKVLDALSELDGMQILNLPLETSVPALWEAGIEAARGRIVALTIEQCVPQEDWAKQVLQAHSSEQAAIGGAVEPGSNLSVVDWAVYFCRYSRFMLPASAEILDDLAGDNASYKREALAGVQEARAEGFWETFVHEALR